MFNNRKSIITPLHKKKLSTIVCVVVKTKKYKAPCFLKRQY